MLVKATQQLVAELARASSAMGLSSGQFGRPELVAQAAHAAEHLFQGYAKAKPPAESAYAAARSFLDGLALDSWQRDLAAYALAVPVKEHHDMTVLGSPRFPALLGMYEEEVRRGELWSLTWHGLLYSYFNFDPTLPVAGQSQAGWERLRGFLERTWPIVDREAGLDIVPAWVSVLRDEVSILTARPVDKYVDDYMAGKTKAVETLASDLGISPSSWFWHALVLGAVHRAVEGGDAAFRRQIPQLLELLQRHQGFRDEGLEGILQRYHSCQGAPPDERLRDYVCAPTIWKNPKLRSAGIATSWNRVSEAVWKMVLGWVNERNLEDFFAILAARNNADDGRLKFWSGYLKQISWTRLVFGVDTMRLRNTNQGVRDLIAREDGAYAQLTGRLAVDAFMMQMGDYLIVEFSKTGNACYIYRMGQLPFDRHATYYDGGTDDLAAGFQGPRAVRIVHKAQWQFGATQELMRLGIYPDASAPTSNRGVSPQVPPQVAMSSKAAHPSTNPAVDTARGLDEIRVKALVARFRGATLKDLRTKGAPGRRGRLWVDDPLQRSQLAAELKDLGFKWSDKRGSWYYPED